MMGHPTRPSFRSNRVKTQQQIQQAISHLRSSDRVLRKAIDRVGPFTLRLQRDRFGTLVRAIISQQISTAAAKTIRERLVALIAPEKISPASLAELDVEQMRTVGVSNQKARYLSDLAGKCLDGSLRLNHLGRLGDEQVIEQLTQVKGIGRWTAEMFLIFSLGRPDVLPCDDLGIRSAIRNLYRLDDLPDKPTCHEIAAPWRPYASVACWYCWRSLEDPGK